jgi:hypothetical protein
MPRYTDKQLAEALRASRGMVYVASKRLGCSDNTVRDRLRRSRALQAVVEDARGLLLDVAELKLAQAVEAGDPWAIQFTLKTRGKDRGYVERCEHHAVVAQVPVEVDPRTARVRLEQRLIELAERRAADLARQERERLPEPPYTNGYVVDAEPRVVEPEPEPEPPRPRRVRSPEAQDADRKAGWSENGWARVV